ncbi:MAG: glycosyltransferase family 2 protein [Vicinamibacterales bacterium]|jgi:glycosyltransferase involved in cell wall biosynthesis
MKPTVDVIVPCFNYGSLLGTCVASVLSQVGVAVRVLIMDDASTDDTEAVGRHLAVDPRVEYRRHPVNRGHIATYNEALALVTGDYCMVLSADDVLTPGALGRATQLMEVHPEVGLVYGADIPFRGRPPLAAARATAGPPRIIGYLEFLRSACRLGHTGIQSPTAVVRTSVHHRIGDYLAELPHSGDTEIWLRMAADSSVAQVDADQAFRRLHAANMSLGYSPVQRLEEQRRAFEIHFRRQEPLTPELATLQTVVNRTIAEAAVWNAGHVFDRGDANGCEAFLTLASATSPGIESWDAWRRLQWKRRLGPAACRLIAPIAARARRLAGRPASVAAC